MDIGSKIVLSGDVRIGRSLNEIENAKKLLKEFGTSEAFGPEQAKIGRAHV